MISLFIANWRLALGAALFILAGLGGWSARGDHEDALRLAERVTLETKIEAQRVRGDQIAMELEAEKRNIKTVTVEVIRKVPEVTTVYVEVPGEVPKPIPDAIYTVGFVGLWNDALAAGLPQPPGQFTGAPRATDSIVRARINQADILGNHVVNAGKWAECRAQLNKLIDWHEAMRAAQ